MRNWNLLTYWVVMTMSILSNAHAGGLHSFSLPDKEATVLLSPDSQFAVIDVNSLKHRTAYVVDLKKEAVALKLSKSEKPALDIFVTGNILSWSEGDDRIYYRWSDQKRFQFSSSESAILSRDGRWKIFTGKEFKIVSADTSKECLLDPRMKSFYATERVSNWLFDNRSGRIAFPIGPGTWGVVSGFCEADQKITVLEKVGNEVAWKGPWLWFWQEHDGGSNGTTERWNGSVREVVTPSYVRLDDVSDDGEVFMGAVAEFGFTLHWAKGGEKAAFYQSKNMKLLPAIYAGHDLSKIGFDDHVAYVLLGNGDFVEADLQKKTTKVLHSFGPMVKESYSLWEHRKMSSSRYSATLSPNGRYVAMTTHGGMFSNPETRIYVVK